jgi:fucose 4-O-acetylase-like acetyltransferase
LSNSLFNTRYILSRDRYPWIDYARGICIILVCFRHTHEGLANAEILHANEHPVLQFLNVFFFSFRMPLFFIISGIFVGASLQKKGVKQFVEDRFRFIFYPFLIWGCIQITMQLIFKDYVNADRKPIDYFNLIWNPREIEQFWYLNALFFVGIIYAFVRIKLKLNSWQQLGLGMILYFLSYYTTINEIPVGLLGDVFFFYIFYAIGDNIATLILDPEKRKNIIGYKPLLVLLPCFLVLQYFFTKINLSAGDDYYVQRFMPVLFAFVSITGCAFIINFSYLLQKLNIFRFLRVIGYHSLFIYIMHLMVIAAFRILYLNVLGQTNVYIFIVVGILAGIFIPMVIYNLAEKMGAGWLFELKKNKEELGEKQSRLKQLNTPKTEKPVIV